MRSTFLTLILCLSPCWGSDPRIITTPTIVAAQPAVTALDSGSFLFLTVANYEGAVTWDTDGEEHVGIFPIKPAFAYPGRKQGEKKFALHTSPDSKSDVLMVFGETEGVVSVAAWGVKDGKPVKLSTLVISVGGGVIPPKPVPPDPDPKPIPPTPITTSKLYAVVIKDTMTVTPAQTVLLNDTPFWDSLKEKGHEWDIYTNATTKPDGTETFQAKSGYLSQVSDMSLPAVLLIEKDPPAGQKARVFKKFSLTEGGKTKTKADVQNIINEITGAK